MHKSQIQLLFFLNTFISMKFLIVGFVIVVQSWLINSDKEITIRANVGIYSSEEECSLKTIKLVTPEITHVLILEEAKPKILAKNVVLILNNESTTLNTTNICVYRLKNPEDSPNIEVELMTANNITRGSISVKQETFDVVHHQLGTSGTEIPLKRHVSKGGGVCGNSFLKDSEGDHPNLHQTFLRNKRSVNSFHVTNWEKRNYYIEVFVVVDNLLYKSLGSTVSTSKHFALEVMNHVSAYYRQFYIHVVLVGLEIWTTTQKIELTFDSDEALSRFTHYRRVNISVKHDNAHLLTSTIFDYEVQGISSTYGMCLYELSTGITAKYQSDNALETASVVAHEMGHNLGLEHDNNTCSCLPDSNCLMAPTTFESHPVKWSDCSINNLNYNLKNSGISYCLNDKPDFVTSDSISHPHPVCGNGIIDSGEECDPGLRSTSTACCNPTTCQLQPNAQCSTGSCCNTTSCKLRPSGALCSTTDSLKDPCDFPEYCDGVSEFCPKDTFPARGTKQCGETQGDYCHDKQCGSRLQRCRDFFGSYSVQSIEACFQMNSVEHTSDQGLYGYCSYSVKQESKSHVAYSYTKCNSEDYKCGSIHCSDSRNIEIKSETIKWKGLKYFTLIGHNLWCYHSLFNVMLTGLRDPGLAPDGSGCGTNKVCVNSKCISLSSVQSGSCSCQNNGQCNNLGSCHCPPGYKGPTCATPCIDCCGGSDHANYCNVSLTDESNSTSYISTISTKLPTSPESSESNSTSYISTISTKLPTSPESSESNSTSYISTINTKLPTSPESSEPTPTSSSAGMCQFQMCVLNVCSIWQLPILSGVYLFVLCAFKLT